MRIVAGKWRGRSLVAARGAEFRPTQGRVREALFSRLGERPADAVVVDLFAGSGSLGLEALSRGARSAVFVEAAAPALTALRKNIEELGARDAARIAAMDAFEFLAQPRGRVAGVTLLFADPPYGEVAAQVAASLETASAIAWGPGAVRVIECATHGGDWATPPGWRRWPERRYGDTRVVIEELEGA